MLDDRMKEGAVDAAVAGLATAVAPWLREDTSDAAVGLVCQWASFQPASGWSHAPRCGCFLAGHVLDLWHTVPTQCLSAFGVERCHHKPCPQARAGHYGADGNQNLIVLSRI